MIFTAAALLSRPALLGLAAVAAVLGTTACGNAGGRHVAGTAATDAATPSAALQGRHRPAPPGATGPACGLSDFQAAALVRVNRLRAAGADCRGGGRFAPAAALAWNATLLQSAAAHARDMADTGHVAHTGRGGSTMAGRIDAAGYAWSRIGENIAAGQPNIDAAVDDWMSSDGHCANLLNADFRDMALACAPGTATGVYKTYWALVLARPR